MATPMSPGTLLDGRYRLDVLLSEHDGARFWRATDTVLARSVAVHVVPSDDPRSPRVLEAARTSATVSDPHFLRVLDCADADGLTWVINEWGEGVSLDVMLARGHLPAMRAAWLTREVAEAIVAAHAQGLCHGRLNPEAVIVTESGAVKLIGFVVNAAFERTPSLPSVYGDIGPRETDVVDLAGILYAALTGKWPGVSPSSVPPAPHDGRKPLRPRQVRAGVPRDLDAICDRVLNKEASQHTMPVETALEIAAALSDFVGDPALVAPVDAPSMHDEPAPNLPTATDTGERPVPPLDPGPPVVPDPPEGPDAPDVPAEPEAAVPDPEQTMAEQRPLVAAGVDYFEPEEWEPVAPLPPFSQPPDRPLFADEVAPARASAPSPAPSPTDGSAVPPSPAPVTKPAPAPAQVPAPPASAEPDAVSEQPRRRRRRRAVVMVVAATAVAIAVGIGVLDGADDEPAVPGPVPTPTAAAASATPRPTGPALRITAVGDFDPEGDPQSENPGRARLAIDGDPGTSWPTVAYPDATFAGVISGVGLIVDLGTERSVSSVEVALGGSGTDVRFFASPPGAERAPALLADLDLLGRVAGAGSTAAIEFTATRTRYLVVWLTRLPAQGERFQGQIGEITVRP